VLNVVVRKPASKGHENVPSVCLQGHLDMVCEKNKDKVHNFEKDPLDLIVKDNFLMANGTTLGADNGVAVATNLAIMEDKSLEHGPLEFLFTVDEETGLTGANNLQPDFIKSKTLMNLDSEEEGAIYVGCSVEEILLDCGRLRMKLFRQICTCNRESKRIKRRTFRIGN